MKKDSKAFEARLLALGQRLIAVRNALGINRKNFASALSFTPRIIRLYEKGEAKPGFEFFSQMIECFGVNPLYLLTGKGGMFVGDEVEKVVEIKWPDGFEPDADGREMLEYYLKSKVVRLNLHAYFSGLLVREGNTIRMDLEKSKGSGKK